MKHFSYKLLSWYDINKRDLPWRRTKDPYHIWVSEIMLQQTQAVTVIPYYLKFIDTLKDIRSLAMADEEVILKLWEGLGYYSRVRNMKTAALFILEKHGGIFPQNYEDIIKLKGIGEYTAGAIISIAFNKPKSALDGNVSRVISRLMLVEDDISSLKTKKNLNQMNENLIDKNRPGDYTQAMIELGAIQCTKKTPNCLVCPVKSYCKAYEQDKISTIPFKSKLKAKKHRQFITAIMVDEDNRYIVSKVEDNLLKGLYLLPQVEAESIQYAIDIFESEGIKVKNHTHLGSYKHVFTHLIWEMSVYLVNVSNTAVYQTIADYTLIPIATAHKHIIEKEGFYGPKLKSK